MSECKHPFLNEPISEKDKKINYCYARHCPDCGEFFTFIGYALLQELKTLTRFDKYESTID